MKDVNDAFGQLLLAQLKNPNGVYEIIERNDGFIDVGRQGHYFIEYSEWKESERKAMDRVTGRVLDIGCGAGRVAIHLQNQGHDVTGLDISPGALKVSKIRGLKKTKLLSIDQIDSFKLNSFDTIIMFGNNFGLFASPKKAKRLLEKMRKITSDDGRIIAQGLDPYTTKDPIHLAYQKTNRERGRLPGQIRIRVRYRNIIGPWFDYLLASVAEIKKILVDTGWEISEIIDDDYPLNVIVINKR